MLRAYCGMRRADRKETAGCITRMTSGYTSILLLQVCQAGNLPVTNIPVWALNFTTNFMLQVIPWKLVAGYMVNKLPVFITGEGTLPASQSLPRGSVLSQFNSVRTPHTIFSNVNFNSSYHLSVHRLYEPFLLLMVFNQNSVFCWIKIDQLMSLALFFVQHVSNASTFIFRSLRLCVGILLWFDVCWRYGVVRLGWCGILMQAEALM